jgi:hypothetical protein
VGPADPELCDTVGCRTAGRATARRRRSASSKAHGGPRWPGGGDVDSGLPREAPACRRAESGDTEEPEGSLIWQRGGGGGACIGDRSCCEPGKWIQ